VEAALTGHLLISTLHTNDAPGTIARLTDMSIEPFMISSSLLCVCTQRLMRRVCKTCRIQYDPEGREKEILEDGIGWSGTIFKSNVKGCPRCNNTGYKGRIGIHELMVTDDELVDGINKGKETSEIKKKWRCAEV
jgi:type IV pilus assembly protein PilB